MSAATAGQRAHERYWRYAAEEFGADPDDGVPAPERWDALQQWQRRAWEAAAAQPQDGTEDGDADLLKRAADALWACAKAALTVEHSLDKPYEDDPRWTPWARWVERPSREAHDLAMAIRKRLREAGEP